MITFKRLSECTLEEAVKVWNEGFAGYFVPIAMSVESFVNRLVLEELSPALSFVASRDNRAVGIVLNGIREVQGRKVAWNGGTGVAQEERGTGIGKAMIEHALELYREQGVHIATLEAIRENGRAIALYKSKGYEVADDMVYLACDSQLPGLAADGDGGWTVAHGAAPDLKPYERLLPWQLQWPGCRRDGQSMLVHEEGKPVAFALYRRSFDPAGADIGVAISQLRVLDDREDREALLRFMLARIAEPGRSPYKRTVPMLRSDGALLRLLTELGFKPSNLEQVFMLQELRRE
ncbi:MULTISPECIES: GNAT family N-acetyltransferase [unclassified Paenibacillus]|uniref:GNAT family N-acetyltransferase n=1 Tax=unclassified Paenibacillus TaxID=185978 RepID=UPI0009546B8B|nr:MULTISPECIES: GNAT family N-acetyltransferase [unclassified Paenibacillus]ASS66956.1 GNAT family N-acetyltransferase [Paenibacillus sp. RUD330]SIR51050.1 Acetyltransferase (GNAT) family protein [Paenibacillus sp. RU4X]SIR60049.1 Acetyltransferase (GNAT) family protein [Paenibacillus sp. RU4T]